MNAMGYCSWILTPSPSEGSDFFDNVRTFHNSTNGKFFYLRFNILLTEGVELDLTCFEMDVSRNVDFVKKLGFEELESSSNSRVIREFCR